MEPLSAALKDERPVVRKMAALVLGDLAPEASEAIPALAAALGDADEGVRRRAAVALGQFGPEATAAVPALRTALSDPDAGRPQLRGDVAGPDRTAVAGWKRPERPRLRIRPPSNQSLCYGLASRSIAARGRADSFPIAGLFLPGALAGVRHARFPR